MFQGPGEPLMMTCPESPENGTAAVVGSWKPWIKLMIWHVYFLPYLIRHVPNLSIDLNIYIYIYIFFSPLSPIYIYITNINRINIHHDSQGSLRDLICESQQPTWYIIGICHRWYNFKSENEEFDNFDRDHEAHDRLGKWWSNEEGIRTLI